ncbi:MAG: T9SS type A sorting domain-containing protein [Lewinellaceae bacterium]|nr:T9SS type A sorting domain-containing protein [Lewinellaceae bacterium]
MHPYLIRFFWSMLLLLPFSRLSAQCNPDVTPPVAICDGIVYVSLSPVTQTVLPAIFIDDGSYDLCCLDTLLVRRLTDGPCDSDAAPDDFSSNLIFCCDDVGAGPVTVVLRVYDCAGNWNECWAEVIVEDKIGPALLAPPDQALSQSAYAALNVNPNDTAQLNTLFGVPTVFENCGLAEIVQTVEVVNDNCGTPSRLTRTFVATDLSGNSSPQVRQDIRILEEYTLHLPADFYPGDPLLDSLQVIGNPLPFSSFYQDQQFTAACSGAYSRVQRTWSLIDWCGSQGANPFVFPKLDMNGDGIPGDAYEVEVKADSVYLVENGIATIALGPRDFLFEYVQILRQNPADTFNQGVYGTVFVDASGNCARDAGEGPLPNEHAIVTGLVTGEVYHLTTDITGAFFQAICPEDTLVEITLDLSWNYGQSCPTTYIVAINPNQTASQDIPVGLNTECPLLTVDLSTPFLRRCAFNTYTVQACNLSAMTVEDVQVEVRLDPYFDFSGSNIPGISIGNNTYSFSVGNLAPGACVPFEVYFNLNCNAPLGFTHCSNASVLPYTICNPPPAWSGAHVEVQALCDGDSVRLSILNEGAGNMAQPLDFVVVEDVIMFQSGTFQLTSSQGQELAVPANGATWRIQARQEVNHPWGGIVATALEGCGGLNTPGLVTLFPMNTANPFQTRDCRQNIGSYDPNDKQAFPRGYGAENLVEANTDLEYLIRFQNTGTDTAFKVVILDTLSALLDVRSVRPGAGSHPYEFSILDGNVLRFRFNNIMLPDSNVNEPASHGFIKFRVAQMPDLADGKRIENSAAIYFDFNDPVITNTTFHTIGDHFILVNTDAGPKGLPPLRVYPNPAADAVNFEIPLPVAGKAVFELRDVVGRLAVQEFFTGTQFRFERQGLPAGAYVFQLVTENGRWTGKLLLK